VGATSPSVDIGAYFAGEALNFCMHPGEQKKYVSPWYFALPRACGGSTTMPQTGSLAEKSSSMFSTISSGSLIALLSRLAVARCSQIHPCSILNAEP
jgi:hypothetical protein